MLATLFILYKVSDIGISQGNTNTWCSTLAMIAEFTFRSHKTLDA